jgi:hypothetical protein
MIIDTSVAKYKYVSLDFKVETEVNDSDKRTEPHESARNRDPDICPVLVVIKHCYGECNKMR